MRRGEANPKTCPGCNSPFWEKELTPYWKHIREKNKQKRAVNETRELDTDT
jgi:hypothetical protein